MKVLLQRTGSGLFFKNLESWVQDENEARSFSTALRAIEFCELNGISGAQVILRAARPEDDIRVGPINPPKPDDRPRA